MSRDFLAGFLPRYAAGDFSWEGSRRENGPPRRDPGGIPVSAGNLGGIPGDPGTYFTTVCVYGYTAISKKVAPVIRDA